MRIERFRIDRWLYKLGFVRRSIYEDLRDRYERLYRKCVSTRLAQDVLLQKIRELEGQ